MRGLTLKESWSYSGLETESHEEEALSDGEGYIQFPRRTIKASAFVRMTRYAASAVNVHGDYGPVASLRVEDYKLLSDEPYYVPGRPLVTQIIVGAPGLGSP